MTSVSEFPKRLVKTRTESAGGLFLQIQCPDKFPPKIFHNPKTINKRLLTNRYIRGEAKLVRLVLCKEQRAGGFGQLKDIQ
jgi:hypothetical protein